MGRICGSTDGEDNRDHREFTAVKYVEATSGANFIVSFRADPSQMNRILDSHVSLKVSLDGKCINGKVYDIQPKRISYYEVVGRRSNMNGQLVMQRFTFGDLTTNEDQVSNIKKDDVKHLGEIQVDLCWARKLGSPIHHRTPIEVNVDQSIPEKCLKGRAISNKATLGGAEHVPGGHVRKTDAIYPHGRTAFATFVFKYRSRKDLQIEGVIEASPEPEPLEGRETKNMSPQEMQALIHSMRAREREREIQIKRVKRDHATLIKDEPDEATGPDSREPKRPRQSPDSGVEVIDLTNE